MLYVSEWYEIKLFAVYVFLGQTKTLVDMMQQMQANQMFENGEYIVIFVDLRTYSPREAYQYIWSEYNTC